MCFEPVTMLVAATAASALGSVYSGMAQADQLKRSAAIDDENSATAIQNSINLRNAGAVNAGRQSRQGRRAGANIRTAAAKGNVVVDSDNSLDAQIRNAMNSSLNQLDEIHKADIQASEQEVQARNFRASASNKRSAATTSMISGLIRGAGAVAGGAYTGQQAGFWGSSSVGKTFVTPSSYGNPLIRSGQ